jgi:hypothetical protein
MWGYVAVAALGALVMLVGVVTGALIRTPFGSKKPNSRS